MPLPCSICSHPDLRAIDQALIGKTPLRKIAVTFNVGRTALSNHMHVHTDAWEKRERRAAATRGPRRKRPVVTVDPVVIESPADFVRELQRAYTETLSLLEEGKRTSDTRLVEKCLGQVGSMLDRFAKMLNLYSDSAPILVDRSQKVLNVIGALSDEQLRALIAGEPVAP